jgi:hypothetical protein
MTMESRQSLEKLRAIADITNALVVQRAELLELREAVRRAEETAARKTAKQRHHEIISTAYRAKADALEMEAQRSTASLPGATMTPFPVRSLGPPT